MRNGVFAWALRDVSLMMRFDRVLPFFWFVVATQLAGRTIGSTHGMFWLSVNQEQGATLTE
jgi:hypothetical protein